MDTNDLEIEYPCAWQFTLFGKDEAEVRAAVERVVGADGGARLAVSKRSSKRTYLSLVLEIEVESDEDRRGLWERFAAEPAIMYVL